MTRIAPITSNERIASSTRLSLQQARREQDRRQADRRVDEEDPLPADVLGEHAADQHAHRAAGTGDGAQTASALLRSSPSANVVERIESAAGAIIAAPRPCTARAAIRKLFDVREAAGERREREERQPGHEQPATAEQVGAAAAEQQEAAEREGICARHPLQARVGEVQIDARSSAARR